MTKGEDGAWPLSLCALARVTHLWRIDEAAAAVDVDVVTAGPGAVVLESSRLFPTLCLCSRIDNPAETTKGSFEGGAALREVSRRKLRTRVWWVIRQ